MTTLALLSTLAFAVAQEEDLDKKTARLIRDLGSEDFETREKATAELKKIGKPAVPELRKAAASEDPEVQLRAKKILDELQKAEDKPKSRRSGGSVRIESANGETVYHLTPAEGDPIVIRLGEDGSLALEVDKKEIARADSLDQFLEEHAELADKYGITRDGIQYGGLRASFRGRRPEPPLPVPNAEDWLRELEKQMEELRKQFGGFGWDEDFFRVPQQRSQAHGATLDSVDEALRSHLDLPEGEGLLVRRVAPATLAARFGIKKFDVLVSIDGADVSSADDAKKLLTRDSTIVAIRGGKKIELKSKDE